MKKTSIVKYESQNNSFIIEQVPDSNCLNLIIHSGEDNETTKEDLILLHKFIGEVLFDLDSNVKLTVPEKPPEAKAPMLSKFSPNDQ